MMLLCAALAVLAVVLALPPPAGRALVSRLEPTPVEPGRPARRPWWLLTLLLAVAAVTAGGLLVGPAGAVLASAAVIAGFTVVRLTRLRRRSRTAAAARAEVAHACRVLAGQLRVGRIPADAVRVAAVDCPVLSTAASLLDLGSDPVQHWRGRSTESGRGGLLVLARAWSVSIRTGAPLAPALERVAESLSADLAIERLVFGEASAARATGKIMAVLPLCGIAMGYLIGGRPVQFLVSGPLGWVCLLVGVLLAALGVIWIDWLSRSAGDVQVAR